MSMSHNGLTKLAEECGELVQICTKKIAFPNTDIHDDGKGSMKKRLEEEIADVIAAANFVRNKNNLDSDFIIKRAKEKLEMFEYWDKQK